MIKEPHQVRELARLKSDEGWRFFALIKLLPRARQREINRLAKELGEAAQAEMDCRTCGACCRENWIPVNEHEATRLASRLQLPVIEIQKRYVTVDPEDKETGIDAKPCPFLAGTTCSVYEDRPGVCRGYPYLGGDIPSRMFEIMERAEVCPIVFEMLEGLKGRLGFIEAPGSQNSEMP